MRTTARLLIRKPVVEDAGFYSALENDPDVKLFIGGPSGRSEAEYRETFTKARRNYNFMTIELAKSREPIGRCGIFASDRESEIHFVFAKQHWRQGYGSEVADELLAFSNEAFPGNKLVAKVHPKNLGSISILKKLGMTQVGTVKSTAYDNGFLRFEISGSGRDASTSSA